MTVDPYHQHQRSPAMNTMRIILLATLAITVGCNRSTPDKSHRATLQTSRASETLDNMNSEVPFVMPAEAEDLDPNPDSVRVVLRAAPHTFQVAGKTVHGFAYNEQVPGPTIRVKRGDQLTVELHNDLDVGSTIHWHGVHVPYPMDGVPWQIGPVPAGETFVYTFTVNQTGTYWYHPHFDTKRQVDLGLYGMLIIEDPEDPQVSEVTLTFDSWHEVKDTTGMHDHSMVDGAHLKWTVNGVARPTVRFRGGTVVRARLLNVSNAGYLDLRWPGIRQIGSDQGLLPSPQQPDHILLAPADRVDVEWRIGNEGFVVESRPYSLNGGRAYGESAPLFNVEVEEPQPTAPPSPAWPFSGTPPSADPTWTDLLYTFHGDPRTGKWLINGESFPDMTIESLPLNSEAIIEVRNLSPTEHPFHIHGHGFEVLSLNGIPPAYRTMEDNINLPIRGALRLKLIANNPGDWMTHCHILPHADGGMMTVLRVLEP